MRLFSIEKNFWSSHLFFWSCSASKIASRFIFSKFSLTEGTFLGGATVTGILYFGTPCTQRTMSVSWLGYDSGDTEPFNQCTRRLLPIRLHWFLHWSITTGIMRLDPPSWMPIVSKQAMSTATQEGTGFPALRWSQANWYSWFRTTMMISALSIWFCFQAGRFILNPLMDHQPPLEYQTVCL